MIIRCSVWGAPRPVAEKKAVQAVRRALRAGGATRGELNIVWTDRARLRAMNRRFRGKRRFTDVIAFRYPPPRGRSIGGVSADQVPFGDLYISVEQARRNAHRNRLPVDQEIIRLGVHGALHLLGYTDYTPRARARMWSVQEPIVQRLVGSAYRGPGRWKLSR